MQVSIHPWTEFIGLIPFPSRLAAMDIGKKTIGLALSTPDWKLVTPLGRIERHKWQHDFLALDKALKGFEINGLIVGLPLNMDDSEGPQAQSVRDTVNLLIKAQPKFIENVKITFFDERLSTEAAQHALQDHLHRHEAKQSGALDAVAAQIILQRAVDALHLYKKGLTHD